MGHKIRNERIRILSRSFCISCLSNTLFLYLKHLGWLQRTDIRISIEKYINKENKKSLFYNVINLYYIFFSFFNPFFFNQKYYPMFLRLPLIAAMFSVLISFAPQVSIWTSPPVGPLSRPWLPRAPSTVSTQRPPLPLVPPNAPPTPPSGAGMWSWRWTRRRCSPPARPTPCWDGRPSWRGNAGAGDLALVFLWGRLKQNYYAIRIFTVCIGRNYYVIRIFTVCIGRNYYAIRIFTVCIGRNYYVIRIFTVCIGRKYVIRIFTVCKKI